MEGCIFCSIAEGATPSFKVFEDNLFTVSLDINPANRGHLIVIPKTHFKNIIEMPDQLYQKMFSIARAMMVVLIDYGAKGVNMLYSLGESAGQKSPHMILHLIPRYDNDKVHFVWEPPKLTEAELREIQAAIKAKIAGQEQKEQQPPEPVRKEPEKPIILQRRTGAY